MPISRRRLLATGVPWLIGMPLCARAAGQGLEQFAMAGPPCDAAATATPSIPKDATFKAGSPERISLLEAGMPGTRVTLTGTVSGITCGRIGGARIDFWQADVRGAYDMTGFRLRGHQRTNAAGEYRLATVVPGNTNGRASHIGVNVVVPGKADFWTEIFFPDDPLQARDRRFNKALVVRLASDPRQSSARAAVFDFLLAL